MDRRGDLAASATLVVGLVTLVLVMALTFRPGRPPDLSAVEGRLDGLENQLATISSNLDAMNATARATCQLVVDSPFIPDGD